MGPRHLLAYNNQSPIGDIAETQHFLNIDLLLEINKRDALSAKKFLTAGKRAILPPGNYAVPSFSGAYIRAAAMVNRPQTNIQPRRPTIYG